MVRSALLLAAVLVAGSGAAAAPAPQAVTADDLAAFARPNDDTVALEDLYAEVHDLYQQLGAGESVDRPIRTNIDQMPLDQRRPIVLSWVRSLRKAVAERAGTTPTTGPNAGTPQPSRAAAVKDPLAAYARPGDAKVPIEDLYAEISALYRRLGFSDDIARSLVANLAASDESERRDMTLKVVRNLRKQVAKKRH